MTSTATATLARVEPMLSPSLYGHPGERVPAGCVRVSTNELEVGHVLQHAPGTFDLVTCVESASGTTRLVHVLRTVPSGRTTAAFFWIGDHARRSVDKVVAVPLGRSIIDAAPTATPRWS